MYLHNKRKTIRIEQGLIEMNLSVFSVKDNEKMIL